MLREMVIVLVLLVRVQLRRGRQGGKSEHTMLEGILLSAGLKEVVFPIWTEAEPAELALGSITHLSWRVWRVLRHRFQSGKGPKVVVRRQLEDSL